MYKGIYSSDMRSRHKNREKKSSQLSTCVAAGMQGGRNSRRFLCFLLIYLYMFLKINIMFETTVGMLQNVSVFCSLFSVVNSPHQGIFIYLFAYISIYTCICQYVCHGDGVYM